MATLGKFTKDNGVFSGTIATLNVRAKLQIVPAEHKSSDTAPDYIVRSGRVEVGAAWARARQSDGGEYLSVKLDDPSFAAPIHATLAKDKDGADYSLIWTR